MVMAQQVDEVCGQKLLGILLAARAQPSRLPRTSHRAKGNWSPREIKDQVWWRFKVWSEVKGFELSSSP